jgi:eukaryotic-like serine/threonine-protein kinase
MGDVNGLIGQVLHDTYRIDRLLGEGGMGAVYAASHLRLARRFAIKMLFPAVAEHPEAMARFKREAEVTSALGHPNIVEVIDFYHMPDGTPYLVMELLEGEDLGARLLRTGRLPLDEAASILRQATSGLQAAHQLGIIHRDLKPQNIFLCRRREGGSLVKVVDFGISKVLGSRSSMTKTHALLGTPNYMAPEPRRSKKKAA